jgi:hypothetical protein
MEEDFFAESSFFVGERDISRQIFLRALTLRLRRAFAVHIYAYSLRHGKE